MHEQALRAIEALVMVNRQPYDTIQVRPLTPVIGAEIDGVDLSAPLTDAQFAEVRRAFVEHHVVVFRDQQLSAEDHTRFGRRFGVLHTHPMRAGHSAEAERLVVKANRDTKNVAGEDWHTDVSCDVEPPMGSMLYLEQTPQIGMGGDTLFANMHLAFDMLSAPMQAFLETLTAVHDGAVSWVRTYGHPPGGDYPKAEHPVVVRHPDTGRKVLFVNRGFTSHIPQLAPFESAALLEMLYRHIETEPALTCRVQWTPNTLVFWDNRCTQHHAIWDYYPLERSGHRVSIVGERPAA